MNFLEELKWRGMVHQTMPGTDELLSKELVTAYVGFDPTADSLHIGHLCSIMILRHFQRCGHKPLALIGGATGMIGDPSGKSQERNLLNEETLRHNVECIKNQLSKFLDFDSDAPNHAELVNNYDWMKDMTFLDFTRDIGKHITVNYMMPRIPYSVVSTVRPAMACRLRNLHISFCKDMISCILTNIKAASSRWEERTSGAT